MNPEHLALIRYLRSAYPGAEIDDYVKSLYEATFGSDALEADEISAMKFLESEKAELSPKHEDPLIEHLGNRFSRIYLSKAVATSLGPKTLVRLYLLSRKAPKGDEKEFVSFLNDLEKAIHQCDLPFTKEKCKAYCTSYREGGLKPLRHSDFYKKAYNPHYLMLSRSYAELVPYFIKIDETLLANGDVGALLKSLPYSISSQIFDNWLFVYPEIKRPTAL